MPAPFDYTPLEHPVTEVAGPIVAGSTEADFRPFGSGILAAPGLAFTARHIVDDVFAVLGGVSPFDAFGTLPFAIEFATLARPSGQMVRWHVEKILLSRDIDIAALRLKPWGPLPSDFSYALPRFNALPPRVGERVWAYGLRHSRAALEGDGALRLIVDPRRTEGSVCEVHLRYRDSSMLHFPCFLTNARFDAGMSGGPVFNEAGQVCGLVCSNLPPEDPDGDHASYVSLIWPVLGLQVVTRKELQEGAAPRRVQNMVDEGLVAFLHADRVRVEHGAERDRLYFSP